jgi:hypothetical protein
MPKIECRFIPDILIGLALSFALSIAGLANQDLHEYFGTQAKGMAGSFRAVANSNDALHYNPAGLSTLRRFNIDTEYLFDLAPTAGHRMGANVVDSVTTALGAGVDYHLTALSGTDGKEVFSHNGRLAAAVAVLPPWINLGLTLKYLHLPPLREEEKLFSGFSLDAGSLVNLPFGLSWGIVGYNLIPTHTEKAPVSLGMGAAWDAVRGLAGEGSHERVMPSAPSWLTFAFDWLYRDLENPTKKDHQLSVGAEVVVAKVLPIRAGYAWSLNAPDNHLSVGMGYAAQTFACQIVYEHRFDLNKPATVGFVLRGYL